MAGSYVRIHAHIVFSTKDRLPFLDPRVRDRVWEYLGGILRHQGGAPVRIGGTADHVHVLTQLPKDRTVPDVMRELKCNSTRWVRRTFDGLSRFAWQEGYAAFGITVTGLERVSAYIAHQDEHHREKSFQQEFVEFLDRMGAEYDERYIWK